jgi:hypothetical protein
MPKVGNARQQRRLSQLSRRIHRAIESGLLSDAPDALGAPVLDTVVTLARTTTPSSLEIERGEAAITELERWGGENVPAYKHNSYARSWMRLSRCGL